MKKLLLVKDTEIPNNKTQNTNKFQNPKSSLPNKGLKISLKTYKTNKM